MLDLIEMTDEAMREVERVAALFEPFDNPLIEYRPHGVAELNAVFGDPTRGGKFVTDADPVWKKKWIVECHPGSKEEPVHPKLARYWWPVHRKFLPTVRELIRRIEIVQPGYITEKGGTWSWNFRHMRHDPDMPLSTHCWAAIDIEPVRNRAVTFKPGKTPLMFSKEWRKVWPDGISPATYAVMKAMGLRCGADWKGYCDPQHGEMQGGRVQV